MRKTNFDLLKQILNRISDRPDDKFVSTLEEAIFESAAQSEKTKAYIESAVELTNSEKESLWTKLTRKFPQLVQPVYIVNPEILGGLRIKVSDYRLDFSLLNHLNQVTQSLP